MDETVFMLDDLYMLQKLLPTAEELQKARLFKGDPKGLSKAERFYLCLTELTVDIGRVCASFVFMLEFREKAEQVAADVNNVIAACAEVQSSRLLKALLLKARLFPLPRTEIGGRVPRALCL